MPDRRRALLTDTEREKIRDRNAGQSRYEAVSRVRRRINEELEEDIQVLREGHAELLAELYATLFGPYQCPKCQDEFEYPWEVHLHAMQTIDDTHADYEMSDAPDWWPEPEWWPDR